MKTKILVLFVVSLLISCNSDPIFTTFQFDNNSWNKFQPVQWDVQIPSREKPFLLRIDFQIDNDFSEESIDFQLVIEDSDGESRVQSFQISVANYLTENANNQLKTINYPLHSLGDFVAGHSYHIELTSLMPRLETKGIKELSFILEK